MKTYKHLYEQYISDENIVRAIRECRPRKRSHVLIDKMLADTDTWIPVVRSWAIDFKNAKHTPKVIYDGVSRKKREIIVPTDKEQIIHHMLMNVFEPVVMKGFYEHAYGSIKGRGAELCKSYIERDIRNKSQIKYFLKMDIRKYYNSINTQILIRKLREVIKDKKYLEVLEEVINVQPIGLPLGFYTSQMLAQFYLKDFDRFVKEELKAPFYYRYVDDIVIHANSKRYLHTVEHAIIDYLNNELALDVNNKTQVFRFSYIDRNGKQRGRDLDFLGYRFFRNKTILRKSVMLKSTRKAKRIYKKNKFTTYDARQMMSYMAKVDKADVYLMYLKRIKPYVSVKKCKRKISAHDRKKRKEVTVCGTEQK